MRWLILLAFVAACSPRAYPSSRKAAFVSEPACPSRHAICVARCERRQQIKPDHGPLTCAQRCADSEGR